MTLGTCIAVGTGGNTSFVIETAGTIVAWGDNYGGTVNDVPAGTFTQVSAGHNYCLALASDGSIVHWGDDPWGYGVDEAP